MSNTETFENELRRILETQIASRGKTAVASVLKIKESRIDTVLGGGHFNMSIVSNMVAAGWCDALLEFGPVRLGTLFMSDDPRAYLDITPGGYVNLMAETATGRRVELGLSPGVARMIASAVIRD